MKIEEAIKSMRNLDDVISITASEHESVKQAIAALEKQIAKKPITLLIGDGLSEIVLCNACEYVVGHWEVKPNYCPDCGTKIDWGNE